MIIIYRNTTEIEQVSNINATHLTSIMGLDEIRISVVTDTKLDVSEGDYILHEGIKYTLNRDAEYEIRSNVYFNYDLTFEHPQYRLIDKLLVNKLTGSTHFTLTGKLIDFVSLLIWSVNKTTENKTGVDSGWNMGEILDSEYKTITIEDLNCRDVLKLFAKVFDCEYFFTGNGKTINFKERYENVTPHVFEQGRELGLYKISQQNVDKENTVTRVYVRGGNRNVPPAYADESGHLKLPENYLENFSELSKVVEKRVVFEEEFPYFLGNVESVTGENNAAITCSSIDFDLGTIAIGSNARINFLTGDLMGEPFAFEWNNALKQVTLIEREDDLALANSDGHKNFIPSHLKKAKVGDAFNFTGILMPDSYVNESIIRLREKGAKWLTYYSRKRVKFSIDIDYRWMRDQALRIGDLVVISIPSRSILKAIRITQLEVKLNSGEMSATVSNYLEESWEKYKAEKIEDVIKEILDAREREKNYGKNTTFFSKPKTYKKGDTWFLLEDIYVGGNFYRKGTMLKAVYETGTEDDWRLVFEEDPTDTTDGVNLIRNYDLRFGFTHWGGIGNRGTLTTVEIEALPKDFHVDDREVMADEYGYSLAITDLEGNVIITNK